MNHNAGKLSKVTLRQGPASQLTSDSIQFAVLSCQVPFSSPSLQYNLCSQTHLDSRLGRKVSLNLYKIKVFPDARGWRLKLCFIQDSKKESSVCPLQRLKTSKETFCAVQLKTAQPKGNQRRQLQLTIFAHYPQSLLLKSSLLPPDFPVGHWAWKGKSFIQFVPNRAVYNPLKFFYSSFSIDI